MLLLPHREHSLFIIKTKRLMSFTETIAVIAKIVRNIIYTVWGNVGVTEC